jgi:hypothetical protein
MAVARTKLICGLIFKETNNLKKAKKHLTAKFDRIDFESHFFDFNYTDYYEPEFGKGLLRQFISFEGLVKPENLATIKNHTINIEHRIALRGRRTVNIDPGYLDLSKLVLATTKDFAHRIYLGAGIYAETTLIFKNKTFAPYDWTYPDYRTHLYIGIFNEIREIYSRQIKNP